MEMVHRNNLKRTLLVLAGALMLAFSYSAFAYDPYSENKYITELRVKAEQGDAKAQYELGKAYFVGVGIIKNYSESVKWYRKAADQGHPQAESSLGTMYYQGLGVPKDSFEAVKWWRKAADHHDADAQAQLGFAYLLGDGVPKNYVYAYMWFNLAAGQGDKYATKSRDSVAKYMAGFQIAEAQQLQQEWSRKHPKPQ